MSYGNAAKLSGWGEGLDIDRGGSGMRGSPVVGSFDEVGVVAAAFDDSRVCPVASCRVLLSGHVFQYPGDVVVTELRGGNPPAL